jgi:SAM-dependent methyltransferase
MSATAASVPERVRWLVRALDVAPGDRLLEIGCGRGAAVALLCDRLVTGTVTAIDRSPTMVAAAAERNAAHVASGRAVLRVASLADADLDGAPFDTVFAINVNLFWLRPAAAELAVVRRVLKPAGALHLCYEPPTPDRVAPIADRLTTALAAAGFTTTVTRSGRLLGVVARQPWWSS